jgi:kumamolisin
VDCASAGTSAAAPLSAALVARFDQAIGAPSGYLDPLLYKLARRHNENGTFRPSTDGENGAYHVGPGWNACADGLPLGDRLIEALDPGKSHQHSIPGANEFGSTH